MSQEKEKKLQEWKEVKARVIAVERELYELNKILAGELMDKKDALLKERDSKIAKLDVKTINDYEKQIAELDKQIVKLKQEFKEG